MTDRRLIEVAFPLRQASLDSVHEKNVRHGHVSTLHIWPARRPLAAARAALIAALLPDPGTPEARQQVLERMGGRVVETVRRKRIGGRTVEETREETVGGILHWGRENGPELDRFRREIREAHGGRAPRVLDPFAGGGAIPLEAMRLGCEATAVDINPVAWFLLKCTLDYPRRLAGQTRPLPAFAREDGALMEAFLKAKGFRGARLRAMLERPGGGAALRLGTPPADSPAPGAGLPWHVRVWGRRALARARRALAARYPTFAEYAPLEPGRKWEKRPLRLLDTGADGLPRSGALNAGVDEAYLKDPRNPRWIAKPTVAYLWARTVVCKRCRARAPLLKTRWLCRKDGKRVLLTTEPDGEGGVAFGVLADPPRNGGNGAQRRESDRRLGAGTMSRAGATCPHCGTVNTMEDIRLEGRAGRLGAALTAVVADGPKGKEYRPPEDEERRAAEVSREALEALYADIPFGMPEERTPRRGLGASRAFSTDSYGLDRWRSLFTDRQLLALGTFVRELRRCAGEMDDYPDEWREALAAYLCIALSKTADYSSALCSWHNSGEKIGHTFARFALPMMWDFCEANPLSAATGGFAAMADWVARYLDHAVSATAGAPAPDVEARSAIEAPPSGKFDAIVTDPPYYDAIPYSDLMDFFHVWLRRALRGLSDETDAAFAEPLGPKWDREAGDGELIDDASRFGGDRASSKATYEDGMARAFRACHAALNPEGRLVVVFANKSPDAWETLAAALIRAGFVVDASWPIRTEMQTRQRSLASAALSSSVWLVCRKRPASARPGWDNVVLADMRAKVARRLRGFWDAGVRGPDFVWAATGPALEAFSEYPVVKAANAPDRALSVSAFLREVRRTVVDFVVGRLLAPDGDADAAAGLDDATAYYLLHRHDFGMADAPAGACILYALSCNLSDSDLVNRFGLLARPGRAGAGNDDAEAGEAGEAGGGGASGARLRLAPWDRRQGRGLGLEGPGGRPPPLIDRTHKLMQLWRAGDRAKVDGYLDARALKRDALFARVLQALIELAEAGSDERAILESLSNHLAAHERTGAPRQAALRL